MNCWTLMIVPALIWLARWHFRRESAWNGNVLLGYGHMCLAGLFLPVHPLLVLLILPATVLIALGTHRYTNDIRLGLEGWKSSSGNKDL